jgi:hypothetical protein
MLSIRHSMAGGVIFLAILGSAQATENGASVFPVGVETVLTGMQPAPGQTTLYNYDGFYAANEFDNASGKSAIPNFKLRVVASAFKVTHNWGMHFLGGTIDSQVAVPLIYQQLTIPVGSADKYAVSNIDIVPVSVANHRGIAYWYYEADLFAPGTRYLATRLVNVGQQNLAIAPVAGVTLLPHKGEYEISSRLTYIFNGANKYTHYHSGNEFFWEYNVDRAIAKKVAIGFNGYFYKQTTDDFQNGTIFNGGFRGRNVGVGPQVRFPLGKQGGFAVKYYRDTLVQNKARGNSLWFQIALPIGPSERHS